MMFEKYKKIKADTPMGSMGGVGVTMPEQKPSDEELKVEGERMQQRTDWWNVPTYTQAVENQRRAAMEAAQKDVNRAKRTRDAALITDMADVFTRMYAQSGNGAWQTPQVQNRAGAANEAYNNALTRRDGLVVDFDGKIAQARMQDYLNKKKQQQADREYELAVAKAKREDAKQQAELMYKQAQHALSVAKTQQEYELAMAKMKQAERIAAGDRASREKIASMSNETRRWIQEQINNRSGANKQSKTIEIPTINGVETFDKDDFGIRKAYNYVVQRYPELAGVRIVGRPVTKEEMISAITKYQSEFIKKNEAMMDANGAIPQVVKPLVKSKRPNPMGTTTNKKPNPML